MGKSLKELINDTQALTDLAATQAGNKVQPKVVTNKSGIVPAITKAIKDLPFISAKDIKKV